MVMMTMTVDDNDDDDEGAHPQVLPALQRFLLLWKEFCFKFKSDSKCDNDKSHTNDDDYDDDHDVDNGYHDDDDESIWREVRLVVI